MNNKITRVAAIDGCMGGHIELQQALNNWINFKILWLAQKMCDKITIPFYYMLYFYIDLGEFYWFKDLAHHSERSELRKWRACYQFVQR